MHFFKKTFLWVILFSFLSNPIQNLRAQEDQQISYEDQLNMYYDKAVAYVQTEEGFKNTVVATAWTAYFAFICYILYHQHAAQQEIISGSENMTIYYPGQIKTRLSDVAGLSGAKADMHDVLSFFKNPKKYQDLGVKVPKGILMNGLPGNGKTMLAAAVGGEANCPFISVAGSSFIQMYVGVGAARVRNLFEIANKLAAKHGGCIIFIDEFDALAEKRSAMGGNNEHDQTIAQLLQCMDGLSVNNSPIVVLAATNRMQLLDPAVIRPGRFDRKVQVNKPAIKDRIELLEIKLKTVVYSDDIDVEKIALITAGFSGAELSNLINEAGLLTVSQDKNAITMHDIDEAFDNITLGRLVTGMDQSESKKWLTAIHEAGHVVAMLYSQADDLSVYKASIEPRSKSLGITHGIPLYEMYESREDQLKANIIMLMCGGLAEQAFDLGKGTGVSDDLARASHCAHDMVFYYGMSQELDYLSYGNIDFSLAGSLHQAIKEIIDDCLAQAKLLVETHKNEIELVAKLLMEKGTVFGSDIYDLLGLQQPKLYQPIAE